MRSFLFKSDTSTHCRRDTRKPSNVPWFMERSLFAKEPTGYRPRTWPCLRHTHTNEYPFTNTLSHIHRHTNTNEYPFTNTLSHIHRHRHRRVSIYQHTLSHTQTHTHTQTSIHLPTHSRAHGHAGT